MVTPDTPTLPRPSDFDVAPENFNTPSWVNAALASQDVPSFLESLSTSVGSAHELFDTSLKSALTAIPWVVRETERIRQRANLRRTNVDCVGLRVAGVESGVVFSVKTIADADPVVRRVQTTVSLLQTALRVDTLFERRSPDSLLASTGADGADLVAAADVVAQLGTSLAPLSEIPELSGNRYRLEEADASLQKLAVPQLHSALGARNAAGARNARIMFDHAGRGDAFREQYGQLRAAELRAAWTNAYKAENADEDTRRGTPGYTSIQEQLNQLFLENSSVVRQAKGKWKNPFQMARTIFSPFIRNVNPF